MNKFSVKHQSELEALALKCKNKSLVDGCINRYQSGEKSSVIGIINMCEAASELRENVKSNQCNKNDLEYFCLSVGVNSQSSQFNKYCLIGKRANVFRSYIEFLPQSISVLYDITQLDCDTFERLIDQNQLSPSTTLHQLRALTNRTKSNPTPKVVDSAIIEFDVETISKESAKTIVKYFDKLRALHDVQVRLPQLNELKEKFDISILIKQSSQSYLDSADVITDVDVVEFA